MGLETNRSRGNSGKAKDKTKAKDKDSKGGATPTKGGGNMPGTEEDDEDEGVLVSKSPPPANGKYRARLGRCYRMRRKPQTPGGLGELVLDKDGNVCDPKLEMIIDDPAEQRKLLAHEPSWHQRSISQTMNLEGNWRSRTNALCAGLGIPEDDWPVRKIKNERGKEIEHLIFPMKALDALSLKQENGKYKYYTITVVTAAGTGSDKGTPYSNITAIEPWIEPAEKTAKKGAKKKKEAEPEPEEDDAEESEESDEEESEDEEEESEEDEAAEEPAPGGVADDDIPF
jgi:hypothetical protein